MTTPFQLNVSLDRRTREGLGLVLDVLLPGTDTLPSGREVGVHDVLIDRVINAAPRLGDAVRRTGEAAADHGPCTLVDIQEWAADDLESVVFALQAAYYMDPAVKRAHHYPGQVRRPIADATPDEVCSEDLLAPVVQRGPVYVPTSPDPRS